MQQPHPAPAPDSANTRSEGWGLFWTAATLACILQGLTIGEAALGITRHAGMALGRADLGWLGTGSVADLALFTPPPGEPPTISSLIQHMGGSRSVLVIQDGRRIYEPGVDSLDR